MGVQHLYGKGPHKLWRVGSRAIPGQIAVSGIHNHLNYCAVFTVQIYFANVSPDRGMKTHDLRGLDAEEKNNLLKCILYRPSATVWARLTR